MHLKSTELKRMGRKCGYKYFSLFLHIFMTPFFRVADCSSRSSFHLCFQNDIEWSREFFQNFIHKNKSMALNMRLLWRHMWDPVVVWSLTFMACTWKSNALSILLLWTHHPRPRPCLHLCESTSAWFSLLCFCFYHYSVSGSAFNCLGKLIQSCPTSA